MLKRLKNERGDTLIEVLFAVAVFSSVVVGSLAIMNQGTAASQRSLEISLVRQQIDAQAETLRFMHDSYVNVYQPGITFDETDNVTSPAEEWNKMHRDIVTINNTNTSDFNVGATCPTTHQNGAFAVDPRNAVYYKAVSSLKLATSFSQLTYGTGNTFQSADGIWVEALKSSSGYIDFHIRACWDSVGLSVPMTLGTIVRLYEPQG
ncbi:MAG: hypothetical protein ABIP50_00240 [Candidatus Saccharimonadales bacterium]